MAKKIFITGASGLLGRHMLHLIDPENTTVLTGTRNPEKRRKDPGQWIEFDMDSDLSDLDLGDVDTIYHLASDTRGFKYKTEVDGTRMLLERAREFSVKHFVYISIVGIHNVPIKYYKNKLATEALIAQSGLPYTILRATQFHDFIEFQLKNFLRFPIGLLPKNILFQPIDTPLVAKKLLDIGEQTPANRIFDQGGPEILSFGQIAESWLEVQRIKKPILGIPLFLLGKTGRALKQGGLTTEKAETGSLTWKEWLSKKNS